MPLRLLKYMIHIFDVYLNKNPKKPLPVIYQLVLYNGKKRYKTPLNIWDMSSNPDLARKFWNSDFQLVNVHNIPDKELKGRIWSGIFELMMKHIHDPDLIKIWRDVEEFLPLNI